MLGYFVGRVHHPQLHTWANINTMCPNIICYLSNATCWHLDISRCETTRDEAETDTTRGAMNPMSKATTVHWQAAGQKEPGKGEELGNLKQLLQKRSTRTLDLAASGFVLNNFTKSLRNWYPLASFRFENKCPLCSASSDYKVEGTRGAGEK